MGKYVLTKIYLDSAYRNEKIKTDYVLTAPDGFSATWSLNISSKVKELLSRVNVSIKEITQPRETRQTRLVEIDDIVLEWVEPNVLQYQSNNRTEAYRKFKSRIEPALKKMGYKTKTDCFEVHTSEARHNCHDHENLGEYNAVEATYGQFKM